ADPERVGAGEVGVLRLAAVQEPTGIGLGVREQNPEEWAVALVAARARGGAHDVEGSPEIRGREQIVVDVRDDREPRTWAEPSECVVHVGKPSKARKRLEVVLDEIGIAAHAEMLKRLRQRRAADVAIGGVRPPDSPDVRRVPVLPLIMARPAHADTMDFSWQSQAWTKTYDSPTQFTVSGPFTLSGQGSVTFAEIVTGGGAARTLSFGAGYGGTLVATGDGTYNG